MKIGIPKERRDDERRAAASPETVKRYKGMGLEPVVEAGAGDARERHPVGHPRPRALRPRRLGRQQRCQERPKLVRAKVSHPIPTPHDRFCPQL